ncbi:DEAD/DEAH box helicase family protein [Rhodocytophaga rosea]|uniref:DEAD/DEAH box helicase family protein n=1 Tax=Rhodocytophaga rosea TaxID=2704465 RepID=A0A6C0GL11_9BACT|nr:DEAD/DEAH box helicase family protein [Rhodocytophaga rosea]QHT68698.1 DEAD/DEAH box helicase family protein [Rhodocytophaga rosea]
MGVNEMLKDADFKIVYSTGEDEPAEFFIDALLESNTFDLGLGYFSSSGIRALSIGFAYFISKGGTMRIIINDILSHDDKLAIEKGLYHSSDILIEKNIINDIIKLQKILSRHDEHFFNCLSWLIATERLQLIAIAPLNNNMGIAHQKFGVFKDTSNHKIAFSGSANFSSNALFNNLESISCYKSWTSEKSETERVNYYESLFEKIWSGKSQVVRIVPIEKVKTHILENFTIVSIEELLLQEENLSQELLNKEGFSDNYKRKVEKIRRKLISATEISIQIPKNIEIRDYQKVAYDKWVKNNFTGIFAMATGTGKTVTALNCVYEEYLKNYKQNQSSNYHLLILVPSQPLQQQWINELAKWQLKKIYPASGKSQWRKKLQELANDFNFGIVSSFGIVATYQTFTDNIFQTLLKCLPSDTILIADEAHNLGQEKVKRLLKAFPFERKIGLSATPKRAYDPMGTIDIELFFNDKEPYCFNFSLEKAIEEGMLCRYDYFPKRVELDTEELEEYINISKKIAQLMHISKTKASEVNSNIERLFLKRKRIVNKAKEKQLVLRKIINDIKERTTLKYCFTYAPGGDSNDQEYEQDNKRIIRQMQQIFDEEAPGISTHTYLGETKDREEILYGFEKGDIDVLLAIQCLDEGIDVPRAGIGIFTASTGNPRQYIQRRGRLLRLHKDKVRALIYDMIVIPKIFGEKDHEEFFQIERKLVRNELMRVGYFAKLSENFYDTLKELNDICRFYKLDLDTIIKDL